MIGAYDWSMPSQLPSALPEPWSDLTTDAPASFGLAEELRREHSKDHVLAGRDVRDAARCEACDHALFALDHDEWAVVHLTWSPTRESDPYYPRVEALGSWDEVFDAVAEHVRLHGY